MIKRILNEKTAPMMVLLVTVLLLGIACMFLFTGCSESFTEAVDEEIIAPEGAPVLFKISDAVKPGKVMSINGEAIVADEVQVAMKLHTKDASPATPPEDALILGIVSIDEKGHFVVATFPDDAVAGIYNVWVKNDAGWSAPIKLNAPRALFMSEKEAWDGQTIQVSGRNFDGTEFNAKKNVRVRLKDVSDDSTYDMTNSITDVNPFCVAFTVEDQPLATYNVEVSNDNGIHWSGLSSEQTLTLVPVGADPLGLGVAWADSFKWDIVFDVTNYDVTPDSGVDETADIQNAINAANEAGGGVVYFPNGKYIVSTLKLRPYVVLMGESTEETNLVYKSSPDGDFVMIESRDEDSARGTLIGYQGAANLKITLLDDDLRPQHYFWLGHDFAPEYVDEWKDRTAKNTFVINVDIETPYDTKGTYTLNEKGRATLTTGESIGLVNITGERLILKNNHWVGYKAIPAWVWVGEYYTEKNNYYEYSDFKSRGVASYCFRENNTFKAHREYDTGVPFGFLAGQLGGMYFYDRTYAANNTVLNVGTLSINDGEAFTTDTAYCSFMDGRVKSGADTSITVVLRNLTKKVEMPKMAYSDACILIIDGKGLGQMREITSVEGQTINVTPAWDVIPDKTSKWTMIGPNRDSTIYRNTVIDASYGTQLFGGCVDVVVADNIYKNSGGIQIFNKRYSEFGGPGIVVNYYNRIVRNAFQGEDFEDYREGIWITTERNSTGKPYNEVQNFQTEIRENIISGDPLGKESNIGVVLITSAKLEDTIGKDKSGDITNTIIEGNTFENLTIGIQALNSNYGQMLVNNIFGDTLQKAREEVGLTVNTVVISDTNYALGKIATSSQNEEGFAPEKAVDGLVFDPNGTGSKWYSTSNEDKWLMVDLGDEYILNRWVVKHAGAGNEGLTLNTADFKLQKSSDGKAWKDVDAVTGNNSLVTDRNVAPFTSRYVRLYITNPGSDGAAGIYEFEVRGGSNMPASGEVAVVEPTPKPLPPKPKAPVVPDPEDIIYYQAEDAKLGGGAATNTNHQGYSGKAFVDGMGSTSSNPSVTFTVNVESAGKYTVTLRLACPNPERYLSLYVNEERIGQLLMPIVAKDWEGWGFTSVILELKEGENTIEYIKENEDSGAINLDYLTVTPVRYEAEETGFTGGCKVTDYYPGFLGTGALEGIAAIDATIPFNVKVSSEGDFSIILRYANAGDKDETISLYVNDEKIKQISLPVTGTQLFDWAQATETVTLKEGNNTVTLRHDEDDTASINLDCIMVVE